MVALAKYDSDEIETARSELSQIAKACYAKHGERAAAATAIIDTVRSRPNSDALIYAGFVFSVEILVNNNVGYERDSIIRRAKKADDYETNHPGFGQTEPDTQSEPANSGVVASSAPADAERARSAMAPVEPVPAPQPSKPWSPPANEGRGMVARLRNDHHIFDYRLPESDIKLGEATRLDIARAKKYCSVRREGWQSRELVFAKIEETLSAAEPAAKVKDKVDGREIEKWFRLYGVPA